MIDTSGDEYVCQDSFPMQCYTCTDSFQLEDCLTPRICASFAGRESLSRRDSESDSSGESGDTSAVGYKCLTSMFWSHDGFVTNKQCVAAEECAGAANRSSCADLLRQGEEENFECSYCCNGPLCNVYSPLDIISYPNPTPRTEVPIEPTHQEPTPLTIRPCFGDTINVEKGTYNWPTTEANQTAYMKCPHGQKKDTFVASRKCTLSYDNRGRARGVWEDPDLTDCKYESDVTNRLDDLYNINVTSENSVDLSMELYNLTTGAVGFTETDVDLSVGVVENVVGTIGNRTSVETAKNLLQGVNNLLDVERIILISSQRSQDSASRVIKVVDQLSQGVEFDGELVAVETDNIAIAVVSVNSSSYDGIACRISFMGDTDVEREVVKGPGSGQPEENIQSSIQLPSSILDSFPQGQLARIQFISYESNKFFKAVDAVTTGVILPTASDGTIMLEDDDTVIEDVVNSPIIAASVGAIKLDNLIDPVVITLTRQAENSGNPECAFWDFQLNAGKGGWSGDGCRISDSNTETDNVTICECDHLTNFALLMDIYGDSGNIDAANQKALSIISYIGCGISLFGLALTILTYMIFSKLRKDTPAKILMNLSSALFIMLLIFLTGSFATDFAPIIPELCTAIAVLLHYFLLAVMCWTALEAFNMYLLLVKVFKIYIARFMIKLCLFGWGVPLVIVAITLGINLEHYGYYNNICWLSRDAFYYSFLLPVGLILLFNIIIYILVMHQLCGLKSKKLTTTQRYTTTTQLRAAIGLMVLLGLTWGLALFAVNEASLVINYLFAIFNSLQGLFIFIFHCIMKTEVRKQWKKTFCCLTGYESTATSSESASAKKYKPSSDKTKLKSDTSKEKRGADNKTMDTSSQL
ncbi:adhesion G-protein coupled receptor G6-like [Glandiceps talaboti]